MSQSCAPASKDLVTCQTTGKVPKYCMKIGGPKGKRMSPFFSSPMQCKDFSEYFKIHSGKYMHESFIPDVRNRLIGNPGLTYFNLGTLKKVKRRYMREYARNGYKPLCLRVKPDATDDAMPGDNDSSDWTTTDVSEEENSAPHSEDEKKNLDIED